METITTRKPVKLIGGELSVFAKRRASDRPLRPQKLLP